ncbi:hypothetical protein [Actimicrobium antarcticum]|uniref:Uncharacterized protein n=1 Tax=Actimicrobium antarcticum TaxID=1051899 RepID=A0ABP7SVL8_9BURK
MIDPSGQSSGLEQIAIDLAAAAVEAGAVARQSLGAGMGMFAYPGEGCLIVGIGYQRDALKPDTIINVLRRRDQVPDRFAAWLPAQFANGSFYVLRRLPYFGHGPAHMPSENDLDNALALLVP